jgi:hypothetical protein
VLNERKASSLYYDHGSDMARLLVVPPPATVRTRMLRAELLLDALGYLVGVDVDPRSPSRIVVMLGPHEKVARRSQTQVGVSGDASGTVCEVRIGEAKRLCRADEKNPYI